MQVVHFSFTPLAGSPIRIVNALRRHTSWHARLIVLDPRAYGTRTFDGDLDWTTDREQALACIDQADILHLHHFFDLEHNPFGLDFSALQRKGKRLVRQFHSTPFHLAGGQVSRIREVVDSSVPQLVIAQYPERYFPRARLVPNLVPLDDELHRPLAAPERSDAVTVFFAPSSAHSAWQFPQAMRRWESKGLPETARMLERARRRNPSLVVDIRRDVPHVECLRARQAADISIDDLVTGSFHLSSLEGLAQGVPTLGFLDRRTLATLAEMAGTSTHPWLNCRVEDAEAILDTLVANASLRSTLGQAARSWMLRYWNDRDLVAHYTDAYARLMEHGETPFPSRFDAGSMSTLWETRMRHDLAWRVRRWRQRLRDARLSHLIGGEHSL